MKHPKSVQQNQLIGPINLRFRQETALCRNLASKDYHADTEARSFGSRRQAKDQESSCEKVLGE